MNVENSKILVFNEAHVVMHLWQHNIMSPDPKASERHLSYDSINGRHEGSQQKARARGNSVPKVEETDSTRPRWMASRFWACTDLL